MTECEKILAKWEPLIQRMAVTAPDFWHDDICQDMRIELLNCIRQTQGNMHYKIMFYRLRDAFSDGLKRYTGGGFRGHHGAIDIITNSQSQEIQERFYSD